MSSGCDCQTTAECAAGTGGLLWTETAPEPVPLSGPREFNGNSAGTRGHYPYGETWYESGTITKLKFITYERDAESGNDYAVFRAYLNRFGPLRGCTLSGTRIPACS